MRDISARELKGHNILAVERFQDNTRWMIEFSILRPCSYGSPGDEMRLFLTEDGYQAALVSQKRREIKIKRYHRNPQHEAVSACGAVQCADHDQQSLHRTSQPRYVRRRLVNSRFCTARTHREKGFCHETTSCLHYGFLEQQPV